MEQCQIPILSHVLKLCNRKALFWEYYTEVFTGKGAWCLQVKEKKSKRERERRKGMGEEERKKGKGEGEGNDREWYGNREW